MSNKAEAETETHETHFSRMLARELKNHADLSVETLAKELNLLGLSTKERTIRTWLGGGTIANWPVVLPALRELFGIPEEYWICELNENGFPKG